MSLFKSVAWTVLVTIGIGALALVGLAYYTSTDMCGNHVIADLPSPDGAFKAIVFQRDCGATTNFSTQVTLLKQGADLQDRKGNVFIEDSDHGLAPPGPGGGPVAKVAWTTNRSIEISHHVKSRVFLSTPLVDGVYVTYTTFQ